MDGSLKVLEKGCFEHCFCLINLICCEMRLGGGAKPTPRGTRSSCLLQIMNRFEQSVQVLILFIWNANKLSFLIMNNNNRNKLRLRGHGLIWSN